MNINTIKVLSSRKFLLFSFILFTLLFAPQFSKAAPAVDMDGYAWSSNIGWISLNCKTGGSAGESICPGSPGVGPKSNYKVTLNSSSTITGFAWSSNIGWIKFGGLSSFPTGGATSPKNAIASGVYPNLSISGWARACYGTVNGDCTGASRTDGSDGWISLAGTNYGVNIDSTGISNNSYAWGSEVIGWIDMFSRTSMLFPTATLTGNNSCPVLLGANSCNINIAWEFTNLLAKDVSVFDTNANSPVSNKSLIGTAPVSVSLGTDTILEARSNGISLTNKILTATCAVKVPPLVPSGKTGTCEYAGPTVTITIDKNIIRSGDTVGVRWTITPAPASGITCKVDGPGMSPSNQTTSGNATSLPLQNKANFRVHCDGPFGTNEDSKTVQVIPKAQEV